MGKIKVIEYHKDDNIILGDTLHFKKTHTAKEIKPGVWVCDDLIYVLPMYDTTSIPISIAIKINNKTYKDNKNKNVNTIIILQTL